VLGKAGFLIDKMTSDSGIDPREFVKSITFISGSIYDNKELIKVNPGYLANLLSQDEAAKSSLLEGNWKFIASDKDIYPYAPFLEMFTDNAEPNNGNRRIIADIALQGSNKFIVSCFDGRYLLDMVILEKSNGLEVVNAIKAMASDYRVPNSRILFDADGVGGFVDGFLPGAIAFHGGAAVLPAKDRVSGKTIKENYYNLKTQLIYHSGKAVGDNLYKISQRVCDMMYDSKMTVRQRMLHERKAFKKMNLDTEGKLRVIPKDEMKAILQGESPDVMDTFFMNEYFELKEPHKSTARSWVGVMR
jgi:hypothetical protein